MTNKKYLTGGEAIIHSAIANGVDTIFGIPGAQIYPLFDGIYKSDIRLIVPRHEQTAAYMAMGYAKSTGKTGVFSVVPGPGILNTSAALCTAMGNCSPIVGLTGQIPSSFMGKGRGHLHELKDQAATLKSLIKDAIHIDSPENLSAQVNQAFSSARSGRPGPVTVEMCWDSMATEYELDILPATRINQPEINQDEIAAAIRLIAAAKNPMIMCGSGAQHAAEEIQALAEMLNAPVAGFRSGRGIISEDQPLGVNPVAARKLWDSTDLLIGIGTRLELPYMRWTDYMQYQAQPTAGAKLIRIDIDPAQMTIFKPDAGIVADSALACRNLINQLTSRITPNKNRLEEIAQAKQAANTALQKVQPQISYLNVIRQVLPNDGFYVPELSQMGFAVWAGCFPVLGARTLVEGGYQGTLGYGFPTALGVKVANPDKAVVAVCGDGGFMFGVQDLITAAENNIGLITLVFNNQAYGNVMRDQKLGYNGRYSGSLLQTPDFIKLADSFGVAAKKVSSPAELKPVLENLIAQDKPALIEVISERGSETSPWEFINMTETV